MTQLLRAKQVCEILSISDTELRRKIRAGVIPKGTVWDGSKVVWFSDEISMLVESIRNKRNGGNQNEQISTPP